MRSRRSPIWRRLSREAQPATETRAAERNQIQRSDMPDVVLLNTGTRFNLGDRAMLINVVRVIRERHPSVSIAVADEVPLWIRQEFHLESVPTLLNCWARWSSISKKLFLPDWLGHMGAQIYLASSVLVLWSAVLAPRVLVRRIPGAEGAWVRAVKSAKTVWCNGGGYLTDDGKKEARAILLTAIIATSSGSRLVMTGQGLGPIRTATTRRLMKLAANKTSQLICREGVAGPSLLAELRIPRSRYRSGVDDACSLPSTCIPAETAALAVHFRKSAFHQYASRVEEALKETIADELSKQNKVRLFVFHERPSSERVVYESWRKSFSNSTNIEIIQYEDPRILRGSLRQCSAAIGMAYHFYLFALLEAVPALALFHGQYYAAKFSGVAANFNEGAEMLDSAEVSTERLLNWLAKSGSLCRDAMSRTSRAMAEAADAQLRATLELAVAGSENQKTVLCETSY